MEKEERERLWGKLRREWMELRDRRKEVVATIEMLRGDIGEFERQRGEIDEALGGIGAEIVKLAGGSFGSEEAAGRVERQAWTIDRTLVGRGVGMTAEFIEWYLGEKKATGLKGIGAEIVEAAGKYDVDAVFILGHIVHETGWGRSRLCRERNNLFGWDACDGMAVEQVRGFRNKGECIDYVVGRIRALYLTVWGKWFTLGACLGRGGPHGYGMNANYASDVEWGPKIARICEGIEKAFLLSVGG